MTHLTRGVLVGLLLTLPSLALARSSAPVYTPPSIVSSHIQSDAPNHSYAHPGSVVTLSFTTSKPVYTPVVLVESHRLVMQVSGSGTTWQGSYTVSQKDHQEKAEYAITLVDLAKPHGVYICTSVKLPIVSYCPPTDGSLVMIDTSAPQIGSVSFVTPVINAATQTAVVIKYV